MQTIEIYHTGTGEVIERMETPKAMVKSVIAGLRPVMGDEYGARIVEAQ